MELATTKPYGRVEVSKFVLAADLGQSTDPTAIAIMEHRQTFEENWHGRRELAQRFDIRHLARLPLGLSYPEVVQEVGRLLRRPPLSSGCELIIDETGVGRAVADIFDTAGMKPTRVSITAGGEQTPQGRNRWHVAKQILISTLDARLHTGELRFAAELLEASAMQDELKDFRRKVSAAGRYSYEARVGKHDDLVLAVALALWAVVGRPKPPMLACGTYVNGEIELYDARGNIQRGHNQSGVSDAELYAPRREEVTCVRNRQTGSVSTVKLKDVAEIVNAPGSIYERA